MIVSGGGLARRSGNVVPKSEGGSPGGTRPRRSLIWTNTSVPLLTRRGRTTRSRAKPGSDRSAPDPLAAAYQKGVLGADVRPKAGTMALIPANVWAATSFRLRAHVSPF